MYTLNYKCLKNPFVKVKRGSQYPHVLHGQDDGLLFPLYWSGNPVLIFSFNYDKLCVDELLALTFLNSFTGIGTKKIIEVPDDSDKLLVYLSNVLIEFSHQLCVPISFCLSVLEFPFPPDQLEWEK